jgi:hypothetical protein
MGDVRITYTPRDDATPEAEVDALAAVYACLLQKKDAEPTPKLDGCDNEKLVRQERRPAWLDECGEPRTEEDKTRPVRRS